MLYYFLGFDQKLVNGLPIIPQGIGPAVQALPAGSRQVIEPFGRSLGGNIPPGFHYPPLLQGLERPVHPAGIGRLPMKQSHGSQLLDQAIPVQILLGQNR